MAKKDFITKEEMGNSWSEMEAGLEKIQSIIDRPYKYSIWITNISLALLAFFIAVLLQIKSAGALQNKLTSIIILFVIVVPIAYGLIFRLKFEIIDLYKTLKIFLAKMDTFLSTLEKKLDDTIKTNNQIEDIKESISSVTIERWKKKKIIIGVIFQFSFFVLALFLVICFLLNYLYC